MSLLNDLRRAITTKKIGILFILLFGAFFFVWVLQFFNLYEVEVEVEGMEPNSQEKEGEQEEQEIENEKNQNK